MFPVDQESLDEWLGPPVDVTPIHDCQTLRDSGGIAFDLYKEACRVVAFAAHLLDEAAAIQGGFARNQAICAGLMVKISKFMVAVIQLSTGDDRGEIVLALNRIIMESAISLEFLVRSKDDKYFDQFVDFSLGPEREIYDQIQANIAARGEVLPIEERLLSSIAYICSTSGKKIEEVDRRHRDWGENLRERLKSLGKESFYATAYRMPSHAVHGNWPDLLTAHLTYNEGTKVFQPETKWTRIGSRLLAPIAILVLDAIDPYLERFLPDSAERNLFRERIVDLRERLIEADLADEKLKVSLRAQSRDACG